MAIPAPTRFTDLRQHLHNAQVDAAYLSHVLTQYLDLPDNMPQQNWFLDPLEDHQAWDYRNALITFQQMIVDKPEPGNGEEPEVIEFKNGAKIALATASVDKQAGFNPDHISY